MADGKLAFLDTETTGLDPERHEVWEVGLILPDKEFGEYVWQLPVDLGRADPMSLGICKWYERRWPRAYDEDHSFPDDQERKRVDEAVRGYRLNDYASERFVVPESRMGDWAARFAQLTDGRHLVGAVVSFDEKRLERLLRKCHACPTWHYHIIDVEALAVGYLSGRAAEVWANGGEVGDEYMRRPPWRSEDLSRAVGVDPDQFDRHTALGDARWAKAIYEKVMGDA